LELEDFLTAEEAARRLGISERAVTGLAASGRVDAVKRGNAWWLDARAVERRRRERATAGRPLSPSMAWSVLLLASGAPDWQRLARHAHQPARARRWYELHPLPEHAVRLKARARRESFDAHPSELGRIFLRDDVMPTGISAAEIVGLHGGQAAAEFYSPESHRTDIVEKHALDKGDGPVLARWVQDELWPVISHETAPRAAVLVDLMEHDDPRARREAARALAK
jgi:excisionase family DNA binding protein